MRRHIFWVMSFALAAPLALGACNADPDQYALDTSNTGGDAVAPEVSTDTGPDDPDPDTRPADTEPDDTTPTCSNTFCADTGTLDDSGPDTTPDARPDTPPDTTPETWRGADYKGPKIAGQSDTALQFDMGIGLYWQTALAEDMNAPHRYIPDRSILHLSQADASVGDKHFTWNLPGKVDPGLHYYKNYCQKVGEQTCKDRGIDPDPSIVIAMVGVHRAPENKKPSDCTYGLIHSKRPCDFGQLVAASHTLFLYVFEPLKAQNVPVLANLGLQGSLESGWYTFPYGEPGKLSAIDAQTKSPTVLFDSRQMFPMLYN